MPKCKSAAEFSRASSELNAHISDVLTVSPCKFFIFYSSYRNVPIIIPHRPEHRFLVQIISSGDITGSHASWRKQCSKNTGDAVNALEADSACKVPHSKASEVFFSCNFKTS